MHTGTSSLSEAEAEDRVQGRSVFKASLDYTRSSLKTKQSENQICTR